MSSKCTFSALRRTYIHFLEVHGSCADEANIASTATATELEAQLVTAGGRGMNVFDRKAKRWHKNRAAMALDADTFNYLGGKVREI